MRRGVGYALAADGELHGPSRETTSNQLDDPPLRVGVRFDVALGGRERPMSGQTGDAIRLVDQASKGSSGRAIPLNKESKAALGATKLEKLQSSLTTFQRLMERVGQFRRRRHAIGGSLSETDDLASAV